MEPGKVDMLSAKPPRVISFLFQVKSGFATLTIGFLVFKVYIGDGKFISKRAIAIAEREAGLGLRTQKLADLFWEDDIHMYSLTGKTGQGIPCNKITDSHINAMISEYTFQTISLWHRSFDDAVFYQKLLLLTTLS